MAQAIDNHYYSINDTQSIRPESLLKDGNEKKQNDKKKKDIYQEKLRQARHFFYQEKSPQDFFDHMTDMRRQHQNIKYDNLSS